MAINIFPSDLKIPNLLNNLAIFINFIYNKQLVKKIHKLAKFNMFKNG
jgi:hypothetical protein